MPDVGISDVHISDVRATLHADDEASGRPGEVILVEVATDAGSTGIGFCAVPTSSGASFGSFMRSVIVGALRDMAVGAPLEPERLWDRMYRDVVGRRGARGFLLGCLAAVDLAVWDAVGNVADRSVAQMLAAAPREHVPTYVNLADLTDPQELARRAAELTEAGHRAMKVRGARVIGSPADATRRLQAVREAVGPDVRLMIDVNGSWDVATAVESLDRWRELGLDVYWLEEPVPPDDLAGYVEVRRRAGPTLIAGGEQHSGALEFAALLGTIDVVQPGVPVVGGLTPWLRASAAAQAAGVPVSPWDLHVVHVHPAAAFDHVQWIEFFLPDNRLLRFQHRLVSTPLVQSATGDGIVVRTPAEPGFSFGLDAELARRTAINDQWS